MSALKMYATEAAAPNSLPVRDVVAWLNTNSDIYPERGMRWLGRVQHGAFVCKREADAGGDWGTRNGR